MSDIKVQVMEAGFSIVRGITRIFNLLPVNNKKLYLRCFDGDRYGFDQKAIAEYIRENYGTTFDLYWEVCKDTTASIPNGIKRVQKYTLSQVYHLKTSKYIIYNINLPPYVSYRKNQLKINTWHGFGNKKAASVTKEKIYQSNQADYFLSCCDFYSKVSIPNYLGYKGKFLNIGFPSGDILFSDRQFDVRKKVKVKLGLKDSTKVVIYAPTFREDFEDVDMGLDYQLILKALSTRFGGEWVLFDRRHPMTYSKSHTTADNVIDVTTYEDMQDLLCTADVLITDYSGSMWSFSHSKRPVMLFVPDFGKYDRGVNFSLEELPYISGMTSKELAEKIVKFDNDQYLSRLDAFYRVVGNCETGECCKKLTQFMLEYEK